MVMIPRHVLGPPAPGARLGAWPKFLFFCFAFICGLRFFLVELFGAPVALGDDLDGIAFRILRPLHDGTFSFSSLLVAHNGDHIIFVTRVWEIFWYYLNGEWDPKLIMMVKAPIYAAAATVFIHLFVANLDRWRFRAAAVLTALFAFPFNYHNLLWAFQSQFDFFLLTSALGWLALVSRRPMLALACALLAPFTLGAGPILAASYVPFFLGAAFVSRTWPVRPAMAFAGMAIAIAAFGASLPKGEHLPRTGGLETKVATLTNLYAWPHSNLLSAVERLPESANLIPRRLLNFPSEEGSWMMALANLMHRHAAVRVGLNALTALFLVAPMAIVAVLVVRKRIPLRVAVGPLGLSVFAGGMLAATAMARANQLTISIRFLDHVALAGFASITACFILVAFHRRWLPWLAVWGLVLGLGYLATAGATLSQMVHQRKPAEAFEALQRYYSANDRASMREPAVFSLFIESDDPTEFMVMLDDPGLRPVLPRAITTPDSARGWAADSASAVGRWGLGIAFVAVCGAAWTAFRSRRVRYDVDPAVVVVKLA